MNNRHFITAFVILVFFTSVTAQAEVRIEGYFIATESCPALHSIKKKTNPGNIKLTEDMAYEVMSKNKFDATHYRIRIKNASPSERWVPVSCGKLLVDCHEPTPGLQPQPEPQPVTPTPTPEPAPTVGKEYLLALSWQPAFCQTHQGKAECQSQTSNRYDATHLTLHGLWPQPRSNVYCGVSKKNKKLDKRKAWSQLPALDISEETYSELIEIMPGVASYLQRHEWIKHGVCYSSTAQEYYEESIMLALQVNNSAVRDFLKENIGERVTASEIRARFDTAFGSGTGEKVNIRCNSGMISELWINLKGEIDDNTSISGLMQNADTAATSCQSGVVDPVGF